MESTHICWDGANAKNRMLARPEPVASAVYAKKSRREMASIFADGVKEVLFSPEAPAPYPLKYAATGFLRLWAEMLRRMIPELGLPLCNTHWGCYGFRCEDANSDVNRFRSCIHRIG